MSSYTRASNPRIWDARLLGRIEGCTNPESAELLPDGQTFVFGNCALTMSHPAYRQGQGIVYLDEQAFISQAQIDADGRVRLLQRQLITGLTATLGIDLLRKPIGRLPAGTAFIATGGNPITVPGHGQLLTDPARVQPAVLIFDPLSGKRLGRIGLHAASPIGQRFNGLDQPNGLAIDAAGNVFVGDIPNGNPIDTLPPPVPAGVYRVPADVIDALADDDAASARRVQRIEMPGFVNGLCASPLDDAIFAVSCSFHDPVGGGLYRLTPADFATERLPQPLLHGLGILDGVGVSRRGTAFVSTPISGEVHAFTASGVHYVVKANGANPVRMPADFNVCYPQALRGEPALLITDISLGFPAGDGSVAVLDISGL